MRNGEFIIHRYGAVRAFRALCTETCLGHTMTPDVMGDTIAVLLRFVLDNVESFSDQLRDTETLWQARRLTDRVLVRVFVLCCIYPGLTRSVVLAYSGKCGKVWHAVVCADAGACVVGCADLGVP